MSLKKIIEYNNTKLNGVTLAEVYGNEKFYFFIYSYLKMQQPDTVIELGTGLGTTAFMMAQALKENKKGKVWTVDNGQDWQIMKEGIKSKEKTHKIYLNKLIKNFNLESYLTLVDDLNLNESLIFNPSGKVDILFSDATDSSATGCIEVLRSYLPIMSSNSSIFIDRASTINHSYLLLEKIVSDLQNNKIPLTLIENLPTANQNSIKKLVYESKFTLINLVEKNRNKVNTSQNSKAWIKIEPTDVIFNDDVYNVMYYNQ